MKLLKYFLFIAMLISTAWYITELEDSNRMNDILGEDIKENDNIQNIDLEDPVKVQIPYIAGKDSKSIIGFPVLCVNNAQIAAVIKFVSLPPNPPPILLTITVIELLF